MSDEHGCSAKVPGLGGWHFHNCSRDGTIEEGGKWWCWQHAPSAVKRRAKKTDARYQEALKAERKRWAIAAKMRKDKARLDFLQSIVNKAFMKSLLVHMGATSTDLRKAVDEYKKQWCKDNLKSRTSDGND